MNDEITPVKENKRKIVLTKQRRASRPTATIKVLSTSPLNKKARVTVNQSDDAGATIGENDVGSGCDSLSQDAVNTSFSGDLPLVIWQNMPFSSPGYSPAGVKKVSPDIIDKYTSTPYKHNVWSSSRSKRLSLQAVENENNSNHCKVTDGRSGGKSDGKSDGEWLNKMLNLVSQLDEGSSNQAHGSSTLSGITINDESFTIVKPHEKTSKIVPPVKQPVINTCKNSTRPAPSCSTPEISTLQNAQVKERGKSPDSSRHEYSASGANCSNIHFDDSSLFSESIADFTSDFTVSDDDNSQKSENSNIPHEGVSNTPHGEVSNTPRGEVSNTSRGIVSNTPRGGVSNTPHEDVKSEKSENYKLTKVKKEPTCHRVKVEPVFLASRVKKEPTSSLSNELHHSSRRSPNSSFRRHSSHDSVITSPVAGKSDTVEDHSSQSSQFKLHLPDTTIQEDIIEKKRRDALDKLKSRRSGRFVRHRSLDSMVKSPSDAAPSHMANKELAKIIEEKRRKAAGKLQRHREECQEKDGGDSLSGSLRQLTPPSSQEIVNSAETSSRQMLMTNSQPTSKSDLTGVIDNLALRDQPAPNDILTEFDCSFSTPKEQLCSNSPDKSLKKTCDKYPVKQLGKASNKSPLKSLEKNCVTPVFVPSSQKQDKVSVSRQRDDIDKETQKAIEQKRLAALKRLKLSKMQSGQSKKGNM